MGENGFGKTTIIKLLAPLYNPSSGIITVDGNDIREFDPVEWRSRIGVIFQDFVKYQMSALENIWMSNVDSEPDLNKSRKQPDILTPILLSVVCPRDMKPFLGDGSAMVMN